MTVTEILQELPQLSPEDQDMIRQRLDQLRSEHDEETPETLRALDEARQAIREGKVHSVEKVRQLVTQWTSKSS